MFSNKSVWLVRREGGYSKMKERMIAFGLLCGKADVYDNMGQDLLDGYRSLLSPHDLRMCEDFAHYKHDWAAKRRLLTNGNLRRTSPLATVLYKFCILINRV